MSIFYKVFYRRFNNSGIVRTLFKRFSYKSTSLWSLSCSAALFQLFISLKSVTVFFQADPLRLIYYKNVSKAEFSTVISFCWGFHFKETSPLFQSNILKSLMLEMTPSQQAAITLSCFFHFLGKHNFRGLC